MIICPHCREVAGADTYKGNPWGFCESCRSSWPLKSMKRFKIERCELSEVLPVLLAKHYLARRPPCSYAFKLIDTEISPVGFCGIITFGTPPSRHLQKSVCPSDPSKCIELNRLWISDYQGPNTASYFISQSMKKLPPLIVASYADTSAGHIGYVYRASNFHYAGWTDMDRKTARFDYVVPGKHSRDAFRGGEYTRVRRKPKIKYWRATGDRRERKELESICGWEKLDWKEMPPPTKHTYRGVTNG